LFIDKSVRPLPENLFSFSNWSIHKFVSSAKGKAKQQKTYKTAVFGNVLAEIGLKERKGEKNYELKKIPSVVYTQTACHC
jgi:hypothetical protein